MTTVYYSGFFPSTNIGVLGSTVPTPTPLLVVPGPQDFFAGSDRIMLNSGQIPRTLYAIRRSGANDVSAETTWSIVSFNCAATIASDGTITITDVTETGKIVVTSVWKSITLIEEFYINKVAGSTPISNPAGDVVSNSVFASTNTTAYTGYTPSVLTIVVGSSGNVTCTSSLNIGVTTNTVGSYGSYAKWQYKATADSTWVDVAAETIAQYNAQVYQEYTGTE